MTQQSLDELDDSIVQLNKAVTGLAKDIDWIRRLGKWFVGTMLTIGLVFAGGVATFAYKAIDVYAQVAQNTDFRKQLAEHERADRKEFNRLERKQDGTF